MRGKKESHPNGMAFLFKKRKLELNYKFIRKAFHNAIILSTKSVPNSPNRQIYYFTSIFLQ